MFFQRICDWWGPGLWLEGLEGDAKKEWVAVMFGDFKWSEIPMTFWRLKLLKLLKLSKTDVQSTMGPAPTETLTGCLTCSQGRHCAGSPPTMIHQHRCLHLVTVRLKASVNHAVIETTSVAFHWRCACVGKAWGSTSQGAKLGHWRRKAPWSAWLGHWWVLGHKFTV